MSTSEQRRLFSLEPWLIRAIVPPGLVGAYLLYRHERPVYAGRSDSDLRTRLMSHAYNNRADYFDFDVQPDPRRAFDLECALYHALAGQTANLIHPASPVSTDAGCFVCTSLGK